MLKLEKGRSKEVNIILYRPVMFWNKIFCKAFLFALGMHLLAISLFHIHNFIFSSEKVLSPVLVEIDRNLLVNESDAEMRAHIEEIKYSRHALMPKASEPELPQVDLKMEPIKFEFASEMNRSANPFVSIEELLADFSVLKKVQKPAVEVFVAGPLAEISLIDVQKPTLVQDVIKQSIHIYEVRVEANTGHVFWYVAKDFHEQSENTKKAEQILNRLQFQTDSSLFAVDGEVTIVLNHSSEEKT